MTKEDLEAAREAYKTDEQKRMDKALERNLNYAMRIMDMYILKKDSDSVCFDPVFRPEFQNIKHKLIAELRKKYPFIKFSFEERREFDPTQSFRIRYSECDDEEQVNEENYKEELLQLQSKLTTYEKTLEEKTANAKKACKKTSSLSCLMLIVMILLWVVSILMLAIPAMMDCTTKVYSIIGLCCCFFVLPASFWFFDLMCKSVSAEEELKALEQKKNNLPK